MREYTEHKPIPVKLQYIIIFMLFNIPGVVIFYWYRRYMKKDNI